MLLQLTLIMTISALPQSVKDITMYLDYARFRYDAVDTYVEIYYLLYDDGSQLMPGTPEVWLDFELRNTEPDSIIASEKLKVVIENAVDGNSVNLGLIKMLLPAGDYEMKMYRLADENGPRVDSLQQEFSTAPFTDADKVALSDLELSSKIETASKNVKRLFYKNTMEIIPNPMHVYGRQMATPKLHYYIELYNLTGDGSPRQYDVEIAIADVSGSVTAQRNYRVNSKYESRVKVGSFDISALKNGLYSLIYAVSDSVKNYSVYRRANFRVINSEPTEAEKNDAISFAQSIYANMDLESVDNRFAQAEYIASTQEIRVYRALSDVDSKRRFMFDFWKERTKLQPGLQDEYYKRVEYVTDLYRFANYEGWKSDRGRVYVMYGKPDRVDRQYSSQNSKPYEIWQYHELQGGVKFLFVDESGFSDFKMVSSTMRGEIQDPNWDNLLLYGQDSGF